jgi:hypothetical protein
VPLQANKRLSQLITTVVIIGLINGCSTWKQPNLSTDQDLADLVEGKTVRLVLLNGSEVTLEDAHVEGDRLIGHAGSKAASEGVKSPTEAFEPMKGPVTTVPLSDIRSIEIREIDAAKTVLRTAAVIITIGLLIYLVRYEFPKSFTTYQTPRAASRHLSARSNCQ